MSKVIQPFHTQLACQTGLLDLLRQGIYYLLSNFLTEFLWAQLGFEGVGAYACVCVVDTHVYTPMERAVVPQELSICFHIHLSGSEWTSMCHHRCLITQTDLWSLCSNNKHLTHWALSSTQAFKCLNIQQDVLSMEETCCINLRFLVQGYLGHCGFLIVHFFH